MNRFLRLCAVFTGFLALYWSNAAHAATVAQLACTNNLTANLSYYDLGFTNTTSDSGGGDGKVAYQPLHFHTAVVNFLPFFNIVNSSKHVETCTLTVNASGEAIVYTFTDLYATSVTAMGRSAAEQGKPDISYLDIQFVYASIQVQSNGSDDGGHDGTGMAAKTIFSRRTVAP